MAEAYEGQAFTGSVGELLQKLDDNPGAVVGIPFPVLNSSVWIERSVEGGYHLAITCEGDADHDKHVAVEFPLLDAFEVANLLIAGRDKEFALISQN
jgi:hypothetical protein